MFLVAEQGWGVAVEGGDGVEDAEAGAGGAGDGEGAGGVPGNQPGSHCVQVHPPGGQAVRQQAAGQVPHLRAPLCLACGEIPSHQENIKWSSHTDKVHVKRTTESHGALGCMLAQAKGKNRLLRWQSGKSRREIQLSRHCFRCLVISVQAHLCQEHTGFPCRHLSSLNKDPSVLSNDACDTGADCVILCCLSNTCLISVSPQQHTERDLHKAIQSDIFKPIVVRHAAEGSLWGALRSPYKNRQCFVIRQSWITILACLRHHMRIDSVEVMHGGCPDAQDGSQDGYACYGSSCTTTCQSRAS